MDADGPATLSGRVVDTEGAVQPGVAVAFVDGPAAFPDVAAITDADGRFTLTAPTPGRWTVGCRGDAGRSRSTVDIPSRTTVTLVLSEPPTQG